MLNCVIRRLNTSPATRDVVRKSYEFALQHVGQDKDSGQIWSDYIQFIKSGEVRIRSIVNNTLLNQTPRLQRHGKNSKKWTHSEKFIIAPCKYLWTTLNSYGMNLKRLK